MAIEYGWTGFEGGDTGMSNFAATQGAVVGVGFNTPRTGNAMATLATETGATNSWLEYARQNTTLGTGMAPGATATCKMRVYMRLNAQVGLNNCGAAGIGNLSVGGSARAALVLNTTGNFAAAVQTTVGAFSAFALQLGTWYRCELTYVLTQVGGASSSISAQWDIYSESGSFIETVSVSNGFAVSAALPLDLIVGNGTSVTSTFNYDFDDWWWGVADGADQAVLAFPVATRITRVSANAQGASADWTGDFRTIIDAPREGTQIDEQSCTATAGLTTTFTHPSAASYSISAIEGVVIRGAMRAPTGSAGNEAFMFGGLPFTVAVPLGAFTNRSSEAVIPGSLTNAAFDAAEFGARNIRGIGTGLRLANLYMEVLHDGGNFLPPFINGTGTWRLNMISYVGNGAYQTISGMGFGASVLMIKPASDSSGAGSIFSPRFAGLTCGEGCGGGRVNNGVLALTADGFELGPNTQVNRNGTTYWVLGMQDGGAGDGGEHLSYGAYVGNKGDNRSIIQPEGFMPAAVHVQHAGTGGGVLRTSAMTGDFSVMLADFTTTDLIQQFLADGFQIGTNDAVNQFTRAIGWFSLLISGSTTFFVHVGTVVTTSSTVTVTGIPFAPVFVVAKRANVGNAFWRASLVHGGLDSAQWFNCNVVTNGITSLTADGFTGGSQIAAAGQSLYWLALAPGFIPPPPCAGIAQPREDGLPYVPTPGQVCAGDGLADTPRTGT